MPISEIFWTLFAAFLALVALFWFIATLYNLLKPNVRYKISRLLLDAAVIALTGGFAYGIYENFLK